MSDQIINQITSDLQTRIESYQTRYEVRDVGTVIEAGDGIARVAGLAKVQAQELVEFANGVIGIAFNLEKERVGVTILAIIQKSRKECWCIPPGVLRLCR